MKKKSATGKAKAASKKISAAPKKAKAKTAAREAPAVPDPSTEERILAAARKLFTQKGLAATRTRDIAAEAGINLALLNYYFRSKEKLFDLVMFDNIRQFMGVVVSIINDEVLPLEEKIELMVVRYIDMLIGQPDIPLFIVNAIRHHPEKLADMIKARTSVMTSPFMRQIMEGIGSGKITVSNPVHFLLNMLGLIVFPFIAFPLVNSLGVVDPNIFRLLMEERKKEIPGWIRKAMFRTA